MLKIMGPVLHPVELAVGNTFPTSAGSPRKVLVTINPFFHYFATMLGIRPAAPGFSQVRIAPQPGPLTRVAGTLPHPAGAISVALNGGELRVKLPPGLSGAADWAGRTVALKPGVTVIE